MIAAQRRHTLLQGGLLIALVLLAYLPALRTGFVWDDDYYVTNNTTLRSLDGLQHIWCEIGAVPQYYPLTHTTFWLEHRLWGTHPAGYHATNILLQSAAALLLWLILRRLDLPGAWLAAALFAIHPVQVESVAWVTERKNVLSGALYLAAGLTYLRFLDSPRPRAYALALLLFIAALLAKTVACSLPAAILLVIWWKRCRITRRDILPLIPFFIAGLALAMLTGWMERHIVGAQGPEWDIRFIERILIASRALWFYLAKLLLPWPLIFIYPRWTIDRHETLLYLFPIAAALALISLFALRQRIGRGPAVAAFFFAGTLLPALGFINTLPMRYSFVADHFQYLACIGPLAAIAALLWPRRSTRTIGLLALAACFILTWQRIAAFANLESLWRDTLAKNDAAWIAHNNLATLLLDRGDLDEAERHLRRAIDLKPNHREARLNLGQLAERRNRYDVAERFYREALAIDPTYAEAHYNLGVLIANRGDTSDAIAEFERAVALRPRLATARMNLATLYLASDRPADAIAQYQAILRDDPDNLRAANNLAIALASTAQLDEAERTLRSLLRRHPDYADAHFNLAIVLEKLSRPREAADELRATLRLDPNHARARHRLARLAQQSSTIPSP